MMIYMSTESADVPPPAPLRKVHCYPIQLYVPCPRLPKVDRIIEGDTVMLKFNGEVMKISVLYFQKLVGTCIFEMSREFRIYC